MGQLYPYPETPQNVPASVTNPSSNFKREVKKVLLNIFFFFIVYIGLITLSFFLCAGSFYIGLKMIMIGHTIAIVAGLGIISIGIMVLIFLIKFIFSVKKHEEEGMVQVTEEEQPALFGFIRQLTVDTQTPFPKKVMLSQEVNASVYYNDSFWSMMFPVKKNLHIGLGLINSLTLSEFKAVMAHEFGHFSQRSMKLGSFVYNVNKAIFNMLYENKGFGNALQHLANVHQIVFVFAWITAQLVYGIQKILKLMYGIINKTYMGLSREMEFHADAVAASVSGSNALITALRKLELSSICYQTVIDKANDLLHKEKYITNIFASHNVVMKEMAAYNNLPLQNNTPMPNDIFFKEHQYSKINIKDQWASHPSRESREKYLREHAVPAVDDTRPAWILFNQISQLQEQFSKMIYAELHKPDAVGKIDEKEFEEFYIAEIKKFDLPNEYNGYYDECKPDECDIEMVCSEPFSGNLSQHEFDSFFNNEWKAYKKKITGLEQDAFLLESINSKKITVKTFDYDGNKMKRKNAGKLHQEIDKQLQQSKAELKSHDEKTLRFFNTAALKLGEGKSQHLKEKYKAYFAVSKQIDSFLDSGQEITNALEPLNGGNVSIPDAIIMARVLRAETDNIKPMIKQWIGEGLFDNRQVLKDHAELLTKNSYQYFDKNRFLEHELASIHILINGTAQLLGAYQFSSYKDWLLYQLEIWHETKAMC